jgi:hypothetical protein
MDKLEVIGHMVCDFCDHDFGTVNLSEQHTCPNAEKHPHLHGKLVDALVRVEQLENALKARVKDALVAMNEILDDPHAYSVYGNNDPRMYDALVAARAALLAETEAADDR